MRLVKGAIALRYRPCGGSGRQRIRERVQCGRQHEGADSVAGVGASGSRL